MVVVQKHNLPAKLGAVDPVLQVHSHVLWDEQVRCRALGSDGLATAEEEGRVGSRDLNGGCVTNDNVDWTRCDKCRAV